MEECEWETLNHEICLVSCRRISSKTTKHQWHHDWKWWEQQNKMENSSRLWFSILKLSHNIDLRKTFIQEIQNIFYEFCSDSISAQRKSFFVYFDFLLYFQSGFWIIESPSKRHKSIHRSLSLHPLLNQSPIAHITCAISHFTLSWTDFPLDVDIWELGGGFRIWSLLRI